jgi:hypothetical protein
MYLALRLTVGQCSVASRCLGISFFGSMNGTATTTASRRSPATSTSSWVPSSASSNRHHGVAAPLGWRAGARTVPAPWCARRASSTLSRSGGRGGVARSSAVPPRPSGWARSYAMSRLGLRLGLRAQSWRVAAQIRTLSRRRKVPSCRVFAKWRDPDSNRGHHDFQAPGAGRRKVRICRDGVTVARRPDARGFPRIPLGLGHEWRVRGLNALRFLTLSRVRRAERLRGGRRRARCWGRCRAVRRRGSAGRVGRAGTSGRAGRTR